VQDGLGNTVTTDSSTITLTLTGGTFFGGDTISASAAGGVATFDNLVITAPGTCSLTAGDGVLTAAVSSSFAVIPSPPTVRSIDRENPGSASTEAASVTYAVTFSEPVAGVASGNFQLASTGETLASSTVVVSPGSGYNSVYQVTVNDIGGTGTLGLNLVNYDNIVVG
jgi:hypothetical protein